MVIYEMFKNEVGNRFEQFELCLYEFDVKFNMLQLVEKLKIVVVVESKNGMVMFLCDIIKYQYLVVFLECIDDCIKFVFVLG